MTGFIFYTIAISAADSLNPITLTQQFALQGAVKKPSHIWFFIIAVLLTNYVMGVLFYIGLFQPVGRFISKNTAQNPQLLFFLKIGFAVVLLILFVIIVINNIKNSKNGAKRTKNEKEKKPLTLTPRSLIIIGTLSTLAEIMTALPYFAFLAVLSQKAMNFFGVLAILFLYNFIYIFPQILLYGVYKAARSRFDAFYLFFKRLIQKCSSVLLPLLLFAGSVFLSVHAIISL